MSLREFLSHFRGRAAKQRPLESLEAVLIPSLHVGKPVPRLGSDSFHRDAFFASYFCAVEDAFSRTYGSCLASHIPSGESPQMTLSLPDLTASYRLVPVADSPLLTYNGTLALSSERIDFVKAKSFLSKLLDREQHPGIQFDLAFDTNTQEPCLLYFSKENGLENGIPVAQRLDLAYTQGVVYSRTRAEWQLYQASA